MSREKALRKREASFEWGQTPAHLLCSVRRDRPRPEGAAPAQFYCPACAADLSSARLVEEVWCAWFWLRSACGKGRDMPLSLFVLLLIAAAAALALRFFIPFLLGESTLPALWKMWSHGEGSEVVANEGRGRVAHTNGDGC